MTFQFECPQGHLLEGDPSHAGRQCTCPTCGVLFLIPEPVGTTPEPRTTSGFAVDTGATGVAAPSVSSQPAEPKLLHIPCPNGHELETPPEMLDQEAMCPHCGAQFRLRAADSVEHKTRLQQQIERQEQRAAKRWFNWAIVTAVLVGIGLTLLILASSG